MTIRVTSVTDFQQEWLAWIKLKEGVLLQTANDSVGVPTFKKKGTDLFLERNRGLLLTRRKDYATEGKSRADELPTSCNAARA